MSSSLRHLLLREKLIEECSLEPFSHETKHLLSQSLDRLRRRKSFYNNAIFANNDNSNIIINHIKLTEEMSLYDVLKRLRILVVGAGGTGCEVLHLLVQTGFRQVDIIDMDKIELSNLNRQFLFYDSDLGKQKAYVAAERIKNKFPYLCCPNSLNEHPLVLKPHCCKLDDMSLSFYYQFDAVFLCLDSIEARLTMNRMLTSLTQWQVNKEVSSGFFSYEPIFFIPFVDMGSEGLMCTSRYVTHFETTKLINSNAPLDNSMTPNDKVKQFKHTSCLACTNMFNKPKIVPTCTFAAIPRTAEHCVLYAQHRFVENLPFGPDVFVPNDDSQEHLCWLRSAAQSWQRLHQLEGNIDLLFVQNVLKNTVPTVPFTNAFIAGDAVGKMLWCILNDQPYNPQSAMLCHSQFSGAGMNFLNTDIAVNEDCEHCIIPQRHVTIKKGKTATMEGVTSMIFKSKDYENWVRAEIELHYHQHRQLEKRKNDIDKEEKTDQRWCTSQREEEGFTRMKLKWLTYERELLCRDESIQLQNSGSKGLLYELLGLKKDSEFFGSAYIIVYSINHPQSHTLKFLINIVD